VRIGYFTNQYPAVSHSFIRREIRALEDLGVEIVRYAIRPQVDGLNDADDKRELQLTRHILRAGVFVLAGCTVRAFCTQPRATFEALRVALGIGWKSERGLLRHLAYLVEATVLASWCRRDSVQHLHAHFGTNAAAIAMLASMLADIPYSFTAHGPDEFEKASLLSLDEKLRRAAFAVCVSSYGRSQLMRWVPSDLWRKIELVHCGLDPVYLRGEAPPPVAAPRIVCVGRLCVQKAQTLLAEAGARLRDDGIAFEIVLLGDGPLRPDLEAAIRSERLEGRVVVVGWASGDRVRHEIAGARVLVLPSLAENLPVVIMEAMALGRPVISTYVAGIPELVRPGENGWLVPPSDVAALTEALREALAAPIEQIARMGAAGRKRVLEQHDAAREAAKLKVLFAERGSTVRRPNANDGR
jgi:glycosyltransferase involved in cell wall biosynthesis